MGRNGFFTLFLVLAMFAPPAFGEAHAGLVYGLSVPDAPNTNHYMMIGIKGSAKLAPWFSTGGYFMVSDKQGQPSATEKFRYSLTGVEAVYHFPTGMWTAARMGITKVNATAQGEDATFSPYHYGIATGYEYKVLSWAVIGFEGSYLHAQRGKTTVSGTTVLLDSFNIVSFLATVQISF